MTKHQVSVTQKPIDYLNYSTTRFSVMLFFFLELQDINLKGSRLGASGTSHSLAMKRDQRNHWNFCSPDLS